MKNLTDINDFQIDFSKIPQEIFELANSLSSRTQKLYQNHFGSAKNFVIVLYYLWFVAKLQKSEIAEILEISPVHVHYNLYSFRWNYSQNFDC
jgi:DNA-directed RNA polymerase specialized sigma subunit